MVSSLGQTFYSRTVEFAKTLGLIKLFPKKSGGGDVTVRGGLSVA